MNKKKARISATKAREIAGELLSSRTEPSGEHISDDLFIEYLTDNLSEMSLETVLAHVETCPACAIRMERLLSESQAWEGKTGLQKLVQIRSQILPNIKESLLPRLRLLEKLEQELQKLILRPILSPTFGYAHAATPVEEEGQTENGTLQWYYGQDDLGNLEIRISSFYTELRGTHVNLQIGTWIKGLTLETVAPDQVGAEIVISKQALINLPLEEGIHIELSDQA